MLGTPGVIRSSTMFELYPWLVKMEMLIWPATVITLAGTPAINCVVPTSLPPSHLVPVQTPISEVKLLPLTVRVKLEPPAAIEVGLMLDTVGGGGATVKVTAADVPLGVVTVMLTAPSVVIRLAGTIAVI